MYWLALEIEHNAVPDTNTDADADYDVDADQEGER